MAPSLAPPTTGFPAVDLSYSKRLDNTTIPVPVSDTDRSGQVQISFDIPLGGKNLGRHTEAVERHQAAQADADDLMLKVSKDITDLQRQYNEARQIAPLLLPGSLSDATTQAIARAESPTTALALLLVSPDFLRR